MKKLILFAIAIAIGLTACGTTTTTAPPTPSGGLTADEAAEIHYVDRGLTAIMTVYTDLAENLKAGNWDGVSTDLDAWNSIATDWNNRPAVGGNVKHLEDLYGEAGNSLRQLFVDVAAIANGSDYTPAMNQDIADCVAAINACQAELDNLTGVNSI